MAEDIKKTRTIGEILKELFEALEKFAKVRHTLYEILLYWLHHYPLGEIDNFSKRYFSQRFLGGKRIDQATPKEMTEALKRLRYAVGEELCEKDGEKYFPGCHGRCLRLVEELNQALIVEGFKPLEDPEKFLNFMTFDQELKKDYLGQPIYEHGCPVAVFHDKENRKEFWAEAKRLLNKGKMMEMRVILRRVLHERRHARPIKMAPKKKK